MTSARTVLRSPDGIHAIELSAVPEICRHAVERVVSINQPFVVRRWLAPEDLLGPEHPAWPDRAMEVVVLVPSDTAVATASYAVGRRYRTEIMSLPDLFARAALRSATDSVRADTNRYYLFGAELPASVVERPLWPEGFKYEGYSLYVASAGVRLAVHYDLWWTFSIQLHGRKRFRVFPPAAYSSLYPTDDDPPSGRVRRSRVDLEHPDLDRYPLCKRLRGMEVTLSAGDLLFLPPRWWHDVEALGFSIGMNGRIRRDARWWLAESLGFAFHALRSRYVDGTSAGFPSRLLWLLVRRSVDAMREERARFF